MKDRVANSGSLKGLKAQSFKIKRFILSAGVRRPNCSNSYRKSEGKLENSECKGVNSEGKSLICGVNSKESLI